MRLSTIGYEGTKPEPFFDVLLDNQITLLIDVRELPLSRKPGFSKTALDKQAQRCGIHYMHWCELGCPRDIRHDYRADEDWTRYTRRYLAHLRKQEKEIEKLLAAISGENACLLCFETDPHRCHRSYVAKATAEITASKLEIIHLEGIKTPVVWQPAWAGISALR